MDRSARGAARRPFTPMLALAATTLIVVAACEGDNLFTGTGTLGQGPPIVTSVSASAAVAEGSQLDVRVKAIAPRGAESVTVRFRRGVNEEETFDLEGQVDTVTIDTSVEVPIDAADSVVIVEAFATDAAGRVSAIVADTTRIVDGTAPVVTATTEGSQASPGGAIELAVSATDRMGLSSVGYAVLNEDGDTLLRGESPTTGSQRDTTFSIHLPTSLRATQISVIATAINSSSLRGVSSPLVLTLVDEVEPFVDIIDPVNGESYTRGIPLRVRVHVRDSVSGLGSLSIRGVSFRNFPDTLQNSTPVVRYPEVSIPFPQGPDRPLPVDSIVVRDLLPNADTTSEPIYIIARLTDNAGNISSDTVRLIAGPRVTILNPSSGAIARVNSQMQVRLQAYDPAAGIDSLKLYISGVVTDTIVRRGLSGTRDVYELTQLIDIGPQTGNLQLRAEVWNSLGTRGLTPQPVNVAISDQVSSDTIAPIVSRIVQTRDRVELRDSIRITVAATDGAGSGISRLGAVVIVIPANEAADLPRDTFYFSTGTFASPRTGTPDTTFVLRLSETYRETGSVRFPQAFTIQVHGYAIDAQGTCGASVQEFNQSLPCQVVPNNGRIAAGQTGRVYTVQGVVGTSVRLPTGSVIADVLPDTTPGLRRVYLSNFARNQVEVLSLSDTTFARAVLVGSQPWGLFLIPGAGAPDTLMVANSGGTNISFVPTDGLVEDAPKRLLTPNNVLWEISETIVGGFLRYTVAKLEFSDRPQFVAQDRNRVIFYSTKPTSAAVEGTLRLAVADPTPADLTDNPVPEVKLIFGRESVIESTSTIAVANVDSIFVLPCSANCDDQVVVYDHPDGFPRTPLVSGPGYPAEMLLDLSSQGSDVFYARGAWDRANVGFADTTYVAYSKDRSTLAFGEGGTGPFGRVLLWTASPSPAVPLGGRLTSHGTADLIGNAAERVMGLALNVDGSFGVARGLNSTYFFSNNAKSEGELRLQGVFSQSAVGGFGGVALHPNHTTVAAGSNPTTLSFIATGGRTIKVVDTFHYFERGEIPIRDNIVGQLRSMPVPPGYNAANGITDAQSCDFTIAQLVGVTDAGNVVLIDVRNKDLQRNVTVPCRP